MFLNEDNYNDIREKSLAQWLDEMERHPDVAVRSGVRLARDYTAHLKAEADRLRAALATRDAYLKKLAAQKDAAV